MITEVRKILLVEDSLNDAEMTMAALQENNVINDVVHVRDGAEALDYLYCRGDFAGEANGHPAFVLLDLKMPKVDGLEVLRQMKADERLRLIPVIMLTSSREEGDMIKSYKLGVNSYVVKPVGFGEFVEAVRALGAFWAVVNEPPPAPAGAA